MKLKLVAVAVTTLLAAGAVNAAEVYNKDGNKLDLYAGNQTMQIPRLMCTMKRPKSDVQPCVFFVHCSVLL
jgi:predicted porin